MFSQGGSPAGAICMRFVLLLTVVMVCLGPLARAELGGHTLLPQTMALSPDSQAHPEQRLVAALDRLAAGQTEIAMRELELLVREQPNFRLAQLIYGDLLQTYAGGVQGLKMNSNNRRLRSLIEEARLRWQQRREAPPADAVPGNLLRMAPWEERVVLVDLKASRLYLLWSVGGRPRVLEDHYIGIGQAGFGKRREGDRRTPVGVYRVTGYLNREALAEEYGEDAVLYGVGALPVSYPNLHDRLLDRTGSGIWLHGVPDNTYVRPPRSSRGCVTMANDDFTRLLKDVVPGHSMVIFSDGVEWLSIEEARQREQEAMAALTAWLEDAQAADSDAFISHYAEDFRTRELDFTAFAQQQQRLRAGQGSARIEIDDLSLMSYPGEENTFLATFKQITIHPDGVRGHIRKQQYWRQQADGRWQIIREGLDSGT